MPFRVIEAAFLRLQSITTADVASLRSVDEIYFLKAAAMAEAAGLIRQPKIRATESPSCDSDDDRQAGTTAGP